MRTYSLIVILLTLVFMFNSSPVRAQQLVEKQSPFQQEGKPSFSLQLGSSFSTGFGGMNLFSQTISPQLSWNINPRWSLTAGTMISSSRMNGFGPFLSQDQSAPMQAGRITGTTVYAFGAYQASERLTLTGGSWVERNHMPAMDARMNPQALNLNAHGMMMGMEYRISDNLRFGAEVRMSSGYNPFNPFHNSGSFYQYGSPFARPGNW